MTGGTHPVPVPHAVRTIARYGYTLLVAFGVPGIQRWRDSDLVSDCCAVAVEVVDGVDAVRSGPGDLRVSWEVESLVC